MRTSVSRLERLADDDDTRSVQARASRRGEVARMDGRVDAAPLERRWDSIRRTLRFGPRGRSAAQGRFDEAEDLLLRAEGSPETWVYIEPVSCTDAGPVRGGVGAARVRPRPRSGRCLRARHPGSGPAGERPVRRGDRRPPGRHRRRAVPRGRSRSCCWPSPLGRTRRGCRTSSSLSTRSARLEREPAPSSSPVPRCCGCSAVARRR